MSNAPSTLDGDQFVTDRSLDVPTTAGTALRTLRRSVRAAGFWSAVALPLAYLPVLAGELGGQSTLGVLLAVHAAALLCGHGYRAD